MATFIAFAFLVCAIVYFVWLLKMCDKDADQREKTKEKTLDGIAFFIAISITIAVVVFVIFLIWVIWYVGCGGGMFLEVDSMGESFIWLIVSILMLAYFFSFFIRK